MIQLQSPEHLKRYRHFSDTERTDIERQTENFVVVRQKRGYYEVDETGNYAEKTKAIEKRERAERVFNGDREVDEPKHFHGEAYKTTRHEDAGNDKPQVTVCHQRAWKNKEQVAGGRIKERQSADVDCNHQTEDETCAEGPVRAHRDTSDE
jgi:hypothetical protein